MIPPHGDPQNARAEPESPPPAARNQIALPEKEQNAVVKQEERQETQAKRRDVGVDRRVAGERRDEWQQQQAEIHHSAKIERREHEIDHLAPPRHPEQFGQIEEEEQMK